MKLKNLLLLALALVTGLFVYNKSKNSPGKIAKQNAIRIVEPTSATGVSTVLETKKPFQLSIAPGAIDVATKGIYFVVAASFPDKTKLQLALAGAAGKIESKTGHLQVVQLEIKNRMAVTGRFVGKDNSPIPKGEYTVFLSESPGQLQPKEFSDFLNRIPKGSIKNLPQFLNWGPKILATKIVNI